MSANTLTGLVIDAQVAADRVLREQIGFLPAVFKDSAADMVALNQNITYPIAPTATVSAVTPAAVPTDPTGQTIGYGQMSISNVDKVQIRWGGEEQKSIERIYQNVKQDQLSQGFRALCNTIESALFLAAKRGSSRAYGTAGATPFATANDLTDVAQTRKILADNGAWTSDMHMVLNTTSGAKIRGTQSQLFKVNEAGDASMLRDGALGRVEGFNFHESNQIVSHTKGTGSGYLVDLTAGYAAGLTGEHVDTGTGTILAGDVLSNTQTGHDTPKYDLASGFASDRDARNDVDHTRL